MPCRASYPRVENQLADVFCSHSVRSSITSLPPLPFLVPAVLEALGQSTEYGNITEVVPGEADLHCAHYLKEHGGLVLTGDSDLLVHDLGPNGAVSFLKDVDSFSSNSIGKLSCHLYQPANIAERLAIPDLQSLAFEIVMDPFVKFPKLVKQAQASTAIRSHPGEFADFLREYVQLSPSLPQSSDRFANLQPVLQKLDPRISELVLQSPCLAWQVESAKRGASKPHVFLPFLLDCPIRTSAWESSTAVRQLAYSLVNLLASRDEQTISVFEHRKQSDKSAGRELELPQTSRIPDECNVLLKLLLELRSKLPKLTEGQLWIAVAVHQNIQWSIAYGKPFSITLFIQQFQQLEKSKEKGDFSWEAIQFFAELQASLYSFRILRQLLGLLIANGNCLSELQLLHAQMQSLPELTDFPSLADATCALRKVGNQEMMVAIKSIVEILVPLPAIYSQMPPKATKKKRKRDSRVSEPPNTKKRPTNLFELLDVE
ncbi:hypothetical protein EG329_001412 [Mollisiaceae sp. DMI_Dod_QoI]|nr:hypothetical protein EG329_001412 [Helotiales sp. DMI_Dod_QoI]